MNNKLTKEYAEEVLDRWLEPRDPRDLEILTNHHDSSVRNPKPLKR